MSSGFTNLQGWSAGSSLRLYSVCLFPGVSRCFQVWGRLIVYVLKWEMSVSGCKYKNEEKICEALHLCCCFEGFLVWTVFNFYFVGPVLWMQRLHVLGSPPNFLTLCSRSSRVSENINNGSDVSARLDSEPACTTPGPSSRGSLFNLIISTFLRFHVKMSFVEIAECVQDHLRTERDEMWCFFIVYICFLHLNF